MHDLRGTDHYMRPDVLKSRRRDYRIMLMWNIWWIDVETNTEETKKMPPYSGIGIHS